MENKMKFKTEVNKINELNWSFIQNDSLYRSSAELTIDASNIHNVYHCFWFSWMHYEKKKPKKYKERIITTPSCTCLLYSSFIYSFYWTSQKGVCTKSQQTSFTNIRFLDLPLYRRLYRIVHKQTNTYYIHMYSPFNICSFHFPTLRRKENDIWTETNYFISNK